MAIVSGISTSIIKIVCVCVRACTNVQRLCPASTADRGESVIHFILLCHFGELHFLVIYISRR